MKSTIAGLALACALAATPALGQTAAAPALVKATLDSGVIVGETKDGVNYFRGVPYAKAPVGELRWKAPEKPDAWSFDRSALAYESPCPQPTNADGKSPNGGGVWGTTHEDCLYMNIYAPANATKAPIVVWMYGGASFLGAGHLGGYNGTENAKQGVITIPINYRLGTLGTFSHPALTAEAGPNDPLGGYALMDAVAALEWVKRNAAAFGGDPNNVTIAGQSAGGFMVVNLLSIPSAKGLYHKAIIQSGSGLVPGQTLAAAEKAGADAVQKLGLPANATAAQLRALSAQTLVNNEATRRGFQPPIDGRFRTIATVDALRAGTEIDVPVMVGSNNGEGGFDAARRVAAETGDAGKASFLYQFAYVPEWRKKEQPRGAPHSAEIGYTFNSMNYSATVGNINDQDRAVAKRVNSCWVAFFKAPVNTKQLTCADGFKWPAYKASSDQAAVFGEKPALVKSKTLPNGPPADAPRGSMAPD